MVRQLTPPRVVWVMVPAGKPTERSSPTWPSDSQPDDLIIDGGNSYYKDTLRRAEGLAKRGIGFLDVGTSGGIWGRSEGYCMMVGGDAAHVAALQPDLRHPRPAGRLGPRRPAAAPGTSSRWSTTASSTA